MEQHSYLLGFAWAWHDQCVPAQDFNLLTSTYHCGTAGPWSSMLVQLDNNHSSNTGLRFHVSKTF